MPSQPTSHLEVHDPTETLRMFEASCRRYSAKFWGVWEQRWAGWQLLCDKGYGQRAFVVPYLLLPERCVTYAEAFAS